MTWRPFDKIGVALFNFENQNEHHLAIRVGDLLYLMEEYPGWYRGHHYQTPTMKGIFPSSFVEIKEHTTEKIGHTTHIVPLEDKVALEANEALREWRNKLIQYYLRGDNNHFRGLLHNMEDVLSWRRKLLHSNVTHDAVQDMRTRLSYKIDSVNNEFHCPLTPRNNKGEMINCHECSAQQLYHVHQDRKAELEVGVIQTGALQRRATRSSSIHNHHLYLVVNKIDHQFPEDVEIFFFLCNAEDKGRQVSERYLIKLAKGQVHRGHDDKMSALFTDLGSKDIQASGMHVICQIVRRGKMLPDDKKNVSQFPFRRPYACGVLEVGSVLQDTEKSPNTLHEEDLLKSFNMPLHVCSTNHDDFATQHLSIIKRTSGKSSQKPGCAITLSLKAFHGDLGQLRRDFPITLTQTMAVVHKLGFPDVILPGDVRNDIYVTLEHGQFEKGSKRAERNVEVAVEVIDRSGKTIPRSILVAAGAEPISEYESFIFYHNNTPRWSETFKLCIPFEQLPDCHLRICFRHVAKNESKEKAEKTFAFTYMNIMKDDGSIIKDGSHEFYVYKAEGKHWHNPKVYLMQVSCKDDIVQQRSSKTFATPTSKSEIASAATSISRSFRETIHLSTLTCSTKLTQKIEILMLLKWRQKEQNLGVVLTNLSHISGEEVVKFLQDTLDCLFEILNSNSDMYGEKVFDVLVSIFGQLQDDKYQHFNTVLDIYITKHFSAVLAYKFLVYCFEKHVRDYGHQPEMHLRLEKVFKSMRYLFRFMVQSHSLHVRHSKHEDLAFKAELRQVFSTFSQLMTYQENKVKQVYKVQSILLANLPAVIPDVVQVLPETDVASMISHILNSMLNTYGTLPRDKLKFILAVLDCDVKLLHSQDARSFLVPTFIKQVVSHMDQQMPRTNYKPEERANTDCMTVIGRMVETLAEPELGVTDDDIEFLSPLIHPLMRLHKVLTPNNSLVPSSLINLIGVLDLMKDIHFATFFNSQKSATDNSFKDFIQDFMATLTVVVRKIKLFHEDWVTMYLVQSRVVSKTIQNVSKALIDGFLNTKDFNPLIWDKYFALCKDFLTQPCLQLEQYSMYRTRLYQLQFGDQRVKLGKHVVVMWHRLGEKKANFIPGLIGPYLEITLLKSRQLRTIALPVVVDMMSCEKIASGNFKRVETEVFDKMDDLLFKGKGDEEYKEMFHDTLNAECCRRKNLCDSGPPFIDSVSRLIALLLDYRSVSTDESYRARRMGCMFNLLNFYKEIDKQELYIRYIYKLAELHQHNQNYTEAGFTLLLHTKGLEWSDEEEVPAGGRFPVQTSLQRREELYMEAIRLFDEGKSWECGIPLCKELAKLYETELFDYQKLAAILRREAEFFQKIIRELRVEPEYFMVGYYGKGFPLFLRNKVFIHRGLPYERLGSFLKRLTDEFSTAEIWKTTTPPDNDMQSSSGMYLQVRSVQPIEEIPEFLKGKRVPEKIAEYYKTNEVQRFRYDRPFHKGQKNKECEFASMWIERTSFTTSNSFPGVISWFEVNSVDTLELNPLDNAIETMNSKNRDIQAMTGQYEADKSLNINPLSMLLNGVIDAAVMGGISNYEKIFFEETYLTEHPTHASGVKQLRQLIEEQTYLLEKALHVHAERVEPSLQAFHSKLESCFEDFQCIVFPEKRQQKMAAAQRRPMRSATIARPLPPTPFAAQGGNGGSPPSLWVRQINRRATGVPGRMKMPSFYEQTDLEPGDRPRQQAKRSVSNVSSFNSPPAQPPPRLSTNQMSPGSKRRLSAEPELPPTPVAGGSNENLALPPQNEEKRSHESSRQNSVNRLSGLSEDEELSNYEPIDGYLVERRNKSENIKVPAPPRSLEGSPKSQSLSQRSSMSDAPHYPAPLPPSQRTKSNPDDDDEDSDGYEPVQLAGQDEESGGPRFRDDVERAVLPLKPGAMRVGSGQPQPQPRSRERSPSYTGAYPSAMKQFGLRERSPTVTQNRVSSESPPSSSMLSSSVPASSLSGVGPSHLIRPPIKEKSSSPPKWADTKSGKVLIPPEPSSPPPSPPVGRDVTMPPGRPIPTQRQKSPSPPAMAPGQPGIPPKKKSARNPSYESHMLQGQSANDDEGIYSFDNLSPLPSAGSVAMVTNSPKRSGNPITMATVCPVEQDNVYFDHLASGPPPRPQKPAIPAHQTSQTSQPDEVDGDNVYFDHLVSGPPVPPPNIPRKPSTTSDQPVQQDDVYFDHLVSGPPKVPGKTGQATIPESQPPLGGGEDNQVYFDHLVPNQPVRPIQPAGPRLPPRRQSSLSSDMKPSNGVKRPPPIPQSPKKPEIPSKASVVPPPVSPTRHHSPMLPTNPPPLPIKKRLTIKRPSESADGPVDLGSSPVHSSQSYQGHTLPVPRPRTNTNVNTGGNDGGPPPPALPPKPATPSIPPKPAIGEKPAPALPSKLRQWPPPRR